MVQRFDFTKDTLLYVSRRRPFINFILLFWRLMLEFKTELIVAFFATGTTSELPELVLHLLPFFFLSLFLLLEVSVVVKHHVNFIFVQEGNRFEQNV